jgi:hypothetical protein
MSAHLVGAAEPGAAVQVEGLGPMTVDSDGGFTFDAALAPWPQTFRVSALDASGNETIREISIVGGIDYRRFPWAAILPGFLLVAVAFSGFFGTRRVGDGGASSPSERPLRPPRWRPAAISLDDGPVAEIEDLPPGGGSFGA